ncbi:MAG: hypothetical protein JSW34_12015 [Candidatus Zixiibacteriota bacterium]|nr:MAG: hypothetical protein JSW34_12015 [candidate division Zixibacteria bacterium]
MKSNSEPGPSGKLTGGKRLWFLAALILLVIVLLEAGLHLLNYVTLADAEKVPDAKMLLSPYHGKEWAKKYFTEMHQREIQYEPYYGWSLKEFNGEYVNIGAAGLRKTWNPPLAAGVSPETLFVFGGSTIWGGGARDDHTIPSLLSRLLHERGHQIHVVNYGTTGHVFGQEVVRLMTALRDGHRPDYVVFYDGTNDVYSAYQSGEAGRFQNLTRLRERFKIESGWKQTRDGVKDLVKSNSMIYRAGRKALALLGHKASFQERAAGYRDDQLQALASDIRRCYRESMELLDYLSKRYGFEYICLLQPVAFVEKKLNSEESGSDNRLRDSSLAALFKYSYAAMATDRQAGFFNIADVLSERDTTYYVDFCHISEEANQVVARRIMDILEKEVLLSGQAGNSEGVLRISETT